MKPKKIAIIGAGTAGLSTVIVLSELGLECDLYEEIPKPESIGAGLLLQPQGLQVLEKMNLIDEIIIKGSKINSLFGSNIKSKIIMDFHYKELQTGLYGLGIHRGSLFESLYKKSTRLVKQSYLGQKVCQVTHDITGAQVTTESGDIKSYDMVVIANGSWSTLNKNLNINTKHKIYPWGALWKIFDNPNNFSQAMLSQRYHKCHTMAGMLPSGLNPKTKIPCLSFFWSMDADKFNQWKNSDLNIWKQNVVNLWPDINPFIDQIKDHNDLTFVRYADTIMNQWHDKKIVIIGDAAHAMSPQLGQGANMALVDAWQLSQSIKQCDTIDNALVHYSKARKKHLRFYQNASRLLTPFFQSNSNTAAFIRDLVFPPMRYIPLAKKHALTTLFGVKTSVLSNKPNVDLSALAKALNPKK